MTHDTVFVLWEYRLMYLPQDYNWLVDSWPGPRYNGRGKSSGVESTIFTELFLQAALVGAKFTVYRSLTIGTKQIKKRSI